MGRGILHFAFGKNEDGLCQRRPNERLEKVSSRDSCVSVCEALIATRATKPSVLSVHFLKYVQLMTKFICFDIAMDTKPGISL